MRLDSPRVKVAAGAVVSVAAIFAIKKAVSPAKKGNENQRPQIAAANETKEVPRTPTHFARHPREKMRHATACHVFVALFPRILRRW